MITLSELIGLRGMTDLKDVKIIRHLDKRMDIKYLRRTGFFDYYQSSQSKDVFNCKRIISCIGDNDNMAIFCGIFDVASKRSENPSDVPTGFPYPEFYTGDGIFYDLKPVSGFEDLEDRVVIDWGPAALAWHQWMNGNTKEVIEILPRGYVMEWSGYGNILLEFSELKAIVENPQANKKWKQYLSAVSGIYLILDTHDGKQYVGSAIGGEGIWGRWQNYVQSGHGGNVRLKHLLDGDPNRKSCFRYSVLQTLPNNTPKSEVINLESLIKKKLGSRAFGLNDN